MFVSYRLHFQSFTVQNTSSLWLDVSSFRRFMLQNFHYDLMRSIDPFAGQIRDLHKKHSASTLMPFSRISSHTVYCGDKSSINASLTSFFSLYSESSRVVPCVFCQTPKPSLILIHTLTQFFGAARKVKDWDHAFEAKLKLEPILIT